MYACVRVMRSKTDLRVSGRQAALRKRPLDFYQASVALESLITTGLMIQVSFISDSSLFLVPAL